ncbi:MAG: response regulator [candidate division Zixibacteria bacterium]|nr:response regulator [candidate division Zixibacteria bacterium]
MSQKKHVLIVDDEPDVVAYLGAVLETCGFVTHTAQDTESGFRLAGEVHPDLICLDIMMPKESGLSLYRRLRTDDGLADIPVVIISGIENEPEFDFRQLVSDSSIPPPDAFFEKPIDVTLFGREILRIVDNRRSATARRKSGTP